MNRSREAIRLRHRADQSLSAARYDEIARLREMLARVARAPGSNAMAHIQAEIRMMERMYGTQTDVAKGHSPSGLVFVSGAAEPIEFTEEDRRFKR